MHFSHLVLLAFLAPSLVTGACAGQSAQGEVRLGISNYATPNPNEELYRKTVETLRSVVAPRTLSVKFYSPGDLDRLGARDGLHLIFGSAGFYRRTALATGNRELVSISSPRYPDPNYSDGSAIVARSDRSDIREVADLKDKRLAVNARFTFTGYIVPMGEVAAIGENPDRFFSHIEQRGEGATMPLIARDVIEGRADAGFLRLCMLETLEERGVIPRGALKVVGERTRPGEPCRRSTLLYPGWTVSSTPRADSDLIRRVTQALLAMEPASGGQHWAVATNYQSVDELYRSLKLGPYEYLREWSAERLIERYWREFLWLVLAMAALSAAAVFWALKARRGERALKASVERERVLEKRVRETAERMDALQRVWAVGELSSTVAHELRQPITSIQLTGRGLMRCIENGTMSEAVIRNAVDTIDQAASRAESIVRRVRAYAKSPVSDKRPIDFSSVAEQSVAFARRHYPACRIEKEIVPVRIMGDAVELELAVANLIRNAAEACVAVEHPVVQVRLAEDSGARTAVLTIADNGPALSEDAFRQMGEPLKTSKKNGLGLGLAIVRAIAESHGGRIEYERGQGGGLLVRVVLPLLTGRNGQSEVQDV